MAIKKAVVKEKAAKVKNKYVEARGGRKTAVARVRLIDNESGITVNGIDYVLYFKTPRYCMSVHAPLKMVGGTAVIGKKGVSAQVKGGGLTGQAEAVRHGLAQILAGLDPSWRKQLKAAGYLMRDPRAVERKKYGLKKARRAPQWAKR